jgi:mono/diheme cytochrome c family protein
MKRNPFKVNTIFALSAGLSLVLTGCINDPDSPGLEYMPDMYRSPAVEAYVDYNNLMEQSAKLPPEGTIPYKSDADDAAAQLSFNLRPAKGMDKTHGWYGYELDENDPYNTTAKLVKNPLEPTEANLANGKTLYTKFCMQCHGEKGDGQGKIVQNGKISGIPAYNTLELADGQMYYSITYGKGLMGAHASFTDRKERWQLVMYVKALQNGGKYPDPAESVSEEAANEEVTNDEEQVN